MRVMGFFLCGIFFVSSLEISAEPLPSTDRMWHQLLSEAQELGLPTRFLKVVPASFVQFTFDDLRTYAAEYHVGEHQMVLNRALSFNGAGATLRPLGRLTHVEIETLYHELFHAYIDYLVTAPERLSDPVLTFARAQQVCRYGTVWITPVVQRRYETEERFLSERESWETLNETWAVFVGWIVWNQLELMSGTGKSIQRSGKNQDEWVRRLRVADQEGSLRGYYEPENPVESGIAQKRYVAPASRLSSQEAMVLMRDVVGFSPRLLARAIEVFSAPTLKDNKYNYCDGKHVY